MIQWCFSKSGRNFPCLVVPVLYPVPTWCPSQFLAFPPPELFRHGRVMVDIELILTLFTFPIGDFFAHFSPSRVNFSLLPCFSFLYTWLLLFSGRFLRHPSFSGLFGDYHHFFLCSFPFVFPVSRSSGVPKLLSSCIVCYRPTLEPSYS